MNDFKVGDIVEAFGVCGIIIAEHGKIMTIQLDGVTGTDSFLKDGRAADWHKEPSLKLVERPKKKVKKILYPAIFKASDTSNKFFMTSTLFDSLESAKSMDTSFIGLGPAIEIEVDDEST